MQKSKSTRVVGIFLKSCTVPKNAKKGGLLTRLGLPQKYLVLGKSKRLLSAWEARILAAGRVNSGAHFLQNVPTKNYNDLK